MLIENLFCILIFILQGILLYIIVSFILSLWNLPMIYPLVITGIFLIFVIILSPRLIGAFFLDLPPEKDEKEDEYNKKVEDKKQKCRDIINKEFNLKEDQDYLLFYDSHPLILTYGGLFQKNKTVLSTGVFDLLNYEEASALLQRERFLSRRGGGFFSLILIFPLVLGVIGDYLLEVSEVMRLNNGGGGGYMGYLIMKGLADISLFPALMISRWRNGRGDRFIIERNKKSDTDWDLKPVYGEAIEKLAEKFASYPQEGHGFRVRVFSRLRCLLPWDPEEVRHLIIWKGFIEAPPENKEQKNSTVEEEKDVPSQPEKKNAHPQSEEKNVHPQSEEKNAHPQSEEKQVLSYVGGVSLRQLALCLREKNPWFRWGEYFSSHGSLSRWIKEGSSGEMAGMAVVAPPFMIEYLPLLGFLAGVVFFFFSPRYFGLPLMLSGWGIILKFYILSFMSGRKKWGSQEDMSAIEVSGVIEGGVEGRTYFLRTGSRLYPLRFEHLLPGEDPLFNLLKEKCKVKGIIRFKKIPFIDIKEIIIESKKQVLSRRGEDITRFMWAFLLIVGGMLLVLIQQPK